ncbi:MAG TPA: gluconokinase [Candidatus Dormibacteraeota bacterium]|nr:gluconokinase [Candidatus Dormibacteraeota bacterium]
MSRRTTGSRRYVMTLDVGTSSVRAMLYDLQGHQFPGLAVHHRYAARIRGDGTAEVDADQLSRLCARCLAKLLRLAGPRRAGGIAAVGVSTFWHGLLAADDSASALTPLYLWSDSRSRDVVGRLTDRLDAEAVRLRTGCSIHPSYWPAKLEWLRAERPDLWKRPVKWLSFGDLLYWRMFGNRGTSLSMASGTGLFLLGECRWDEELLSELYISPASLPPIAEAERGLSARYRRLLPELADVPWVHAAGDGALANLGSDCVSVADRALTVGTSGALRVMHGRSTQRVPEGLWRYRLDRARLVTGGAISNGGNLRDWLLRTLRLTDKRLEEQMRGAEPGAHGLTFLPNLAGERSPGFATHALGAIAGLTSATTADDIARAGLEAVAIEFAQIDRKLDEVLPGAKRLVASGTALLRSPAWMQMIADATGRPIVKARDKEASSRGAALFAAERLGIDHHAETELQSGRELKPNGDHANTYMKAEARKNALYRALTIDRILDRAE